MSSCPVAMTSAFFADSQESQERLHLDQDSQNALELQGADFGTATLDGADGGASQDVLPSFAAELPQWLAGTGAGDQPLSQESAVSNDSSHAASLAASTFVFGVPGDVGDVASLAVAGACGADGDTTKRGTKRNVSELLGAAGGVGRVGRPFPRLAGVPRRSSSLPAPRKQPMCDQRPSWLPSTFEFFAGATEKLRHPGGLRAQASAAASTRAAPSPLPEQLTPLKLQNPARTLRKASTDPGDPGSAVYHPICICPDCCGLAYDLPVGYTYYCGRDECVAALQVWTWNDINDADDNNYAGAQQSGETEDKE